MIQLKIAGAIAACAYCIYAIVKTPKADNKKPEEKTGENPAEIETETPPVTEDEIEAAALAEIQAASAGNGEE